MVQLLPNVFLALVIKKVAASNVFAQLTADPSMPVSAFHNQLTAAEEPSCTGNQSC